MEEPKPRRPWWRRKRAWAAIALTPFLGYSIGYGPAVYVAARGWLPPALADAAFAPAKLARLVPGLRHPVTVYAGWWAGLAAEHAASD